MSHGKCGVQYCSHSGPHLDWISTLISATWENVNSIAPKSICNINKLIDKKIQISSSLINGCDTRFLINLCFLAVDRKRKEHYMALTGSDVHMKLSSCLVVCYCLEAHVTPYVAEKSSFHSGSKLSWLYNNLVKKMDQNQSTKACFVCFCSVMFFFLILGIVFDSFFLNVSVIRRVFFGWLHATLQGHNCLVPASVP